MGDIDYKQRADNAMAQVHYMCAQIAKALGQSKVSTPSDTVMMVSALAARAGITPTTDAQLEKTT